MNSRLTNTCRYILAFVASAGTAKMRDAIANVAKVVFVVFAMHRAIFAIGSLVYVIGIVVFILGTSAEFGAPLSSRLHDEWGLPMIGGCRKWRGRTQPRCSEKWPLQTLVVAIQGSYVRGVLIKRPSKKRKAEKRQGKERETRTSHAGDTPSQLAPPKGVKPSKPSHSRSNCPCNALPKPPKQSTLAMTADNANPNVTRVMSSVMPRPGQPGALLFDNTNISEFLERWNIECDAFGLTTTERCVNLPLYCIRPTMKLVKAFKGYAARDWGLLQEELKSFFFEEDREKTTVISLLKLVAESAAGKVDLRSYVINFTAMGNELKEQGNLSDTERIRYFAKGLPADVRHKLFDFCRKKGWDMSMPGTAEKRIDFDKIVKFVFEKEESK